ncbi:MAG: hypothetical protein L0956_04820 [Candidatus Mariimomonas ferrooxydans]
MRIERSPRFDRAYKKLPKAVREHFKEKLILLDVSNFSHPSLRVKKIKGTAHIWEASIDMSHRFTFEKIEGGIKLRVVGPHKVINMP